jgi:hypothetical protein
MRLVLRICQTSISVSRNGGFCPVPCGPTPLEEAHIDPADVESVSLVQRPDGAWWKFSRARRRLA